MRWWPTIAAAPILTVRHAATATPAATRAAANLIEGRGTSTLLLTLALRPGRCRRVPPRSAPRTRRAAHDHAAAGRPETPPPWQRRPGRGVPRARRPYRH